MSHKSRCTTSNRAVPGQYTYTPQPFRVSRSFNVRERGEKHGIYRNQGPDAARHRHRLLAAPALVHDEPVGPPARHRHDGPVVSRAVHRRARHRRLRPGARRPGHPHHRRLPPGRGRRRAAPGTIIRCSDGRGWSTRNCRPRRPARRCSPIRSARCWIRSTRRGAGRAWSARSSTIRRTRSSTPRSGASPSKPRPRPASR